MEKIIDVLQKNALLFVLLFFVSSVCSCTTTTRLQSRDNANVIWANQRELERVENIATALGEFHNRAIERIGVIRDQANGIGETVDRLEFLFTSYEREVNLLLGQINTLRVQIEIERKNNSNTNDNCNN